MRLAALLFVAACHTSTSTIARTSTNASPTPSRNPTPRTITIDEHGIGFDDLVFANRRVLVPAGATGVLAVIDPETAAMESMRATPVRPGAYVAGHHDRGVTSVATTPIRYVVADRTTKTLIALDSGISVPLAAEPDYVRFIDATDDVWVTEPDAAQIEVVHISRLANDPPFLRLMTFAVPGGPESLVVSASRKTAYANLWHAKSVEFDLASRAIKRTFDTACEKTRGLALDDADGLLFVACNDGRIVRLELESGKMTEARAGDGVDIIDFSAKTGHLYVPASRAGTLTIFTSALAVVKTERSGPRRGRRFLGKPLIWERP